MHLLNPFRRYSDFLKSGFHAFTNRARKQSNETPPHHSMLDTPYLTPNASFSNTTATECRQRVLSMPNKPHERVERRRSSPSLSSSHLFVHNKSTPNFNETSTIFFKRSSTSTADSRDSEVWIAEGGLYTVPAINERYIYYYSSMILAGTKEK